MTTKKTIIPIIFAALMTGCATPTIIHGNEASVLVDHIDRFSMQQGFAIADEHCGKYGKVARLTNGGGQYSAAFDCVPKQK